MLPLIANAVNTLKTGFVMVCVRRLVLLVIVEANLKAEERSAAALGQENSKLQELTKLLRVAWVAKAEL